MGNLFGLTIDGKHTSEFGLKLTAIYIPFPSVNETIITVPGMSGAIDASEVLTGYPTYQIRKGLSFTFKLYKDWQNFEYVKSQLAAWIHGKRSKVVLDNDTSYYYLARLSIDAKKTNRINAEISITGNADPLKYEITASDEEWLWDPFDFEIGVIRELSEIEITETNNTVTVLAGWYPVSPTFIVTESVNLAIDYNGVKYALPAGQTKIPSIKIGNEDTILIFSGRGKLSISYRGEVL